jgi:hypothetical protein
MMTGYWDAKGTTYTVLESGTGRSMPVQLLAADDEMRDPSFLQEFEHYARESVARDFKTPSPTPHTPEQRKELGSILKDINKSHFYWAENNHGRFWEGSKI